MIKRMFFLSGVIAFLLASAAIWFWYLPRMEQQKVPSPKPQETVKTVSDTVMVSEKDSLR